MIVKQPNVVKPIVGSIDGNVAVYKKPSMYTNDAHILQALAFKLAGNITAVIHQMIGPQPKF